MRKSHEFERRNLLMTALALSSSLSLLPPRLTPHPPTPRKVLKCAVARLSFLVKSYRMVRAGIRNNAGFCSCKYSK